MAPKGFEFSIDGDRVDPKKLGAALRALRESCGVSSTVLAEKIGWNPQNLLRLERGGSGREPTLSSMLAYLTGLELKFVLVGKPRQGSRSKRAARADGDTGADD